MFQRVYVYIFYLYRYKYICCNDLNLITRLKKDRLYKTNVKTKQGRGSTVTAIEAISIKCFY